MNPPNPPGPTPPFEPRWDWQGSVVVVLLGIALIGSGAYGVLWYLEWAPSGTTYETGINESRTHQLDDGTRMSLRARTKVRVHFTKERRVVQHLGGDVSFDVGLDPDKPFMVRTFLADLTQGTKFRVVVDTGVSVWVHDGVVKVENSEGRPGTAIELKPGPRHDLAIQNLARAHGFGFSGRMHACGV